MLTSLQDNGNNKKIKTHKSGNINLSEIIDSIKFRIEKHREYIHIDVETIKEYALYPEIVNAAVKRMLERDAKIGELEELIEYSLGGDLK